MEIVPWQTRIRIAITPMHSLWRRKKWLHRVSVTPKSTLMNTIAWAWLLRKIRRKKKWSKHTNNSVHNFKQTDIYASFICSYALFFHKWASIHLLMKMVSERQLLLRSSWLRRMNSVSRAWKTFWWKIISKNHFLTRMFQKVLGIQSQKKRNRTTPTLRSRARCNSRN